MRTLSALVIEDEPHIRELLGDLVRAEGYETSCAADAHEGLQCVESREPDVIFLDLMLPDVDGFHVCRRLKEHRRRNPIPILVITALASAEHRLCALQAGANAYLTKPFSVADVRGALDDAMLWRGRLASGMTQVRAVARHDQPETFLHGVNEIWSALLMEAPLTGQEVEAIVRALREGVWMLVYGDPRRFEAVRAFARLYPSRVELLIEASTDDAPDGHGSFADFGVEREDDEQWTVPIEGALLPSSGDAAHAGRALAERLLRAAATRLEVAVRLCEHFAPRMAPEEGARGTAGTFHLKPVTNRATLPSPEGDSRPDPLRPALHTLTGVAVWLHRALKTGAPAAAGRVAHGAAVLNRTLYRYFELKQSGDHLEQLEMTAPHESGVLKKLVVEQLMIMELARDLCERIAAAEPEQWPWLADELAELLERFERWLEMDRGVVYTAYALDVGVGD